MTEAIVARAQGNYAKVSDIAEDVRAKLVGGTVGVIFPILSRNRFSVCLSGIAKGAALGEEDRPYALLPLRRGGQPPHRRGPAG